MKPILLSMALLCTLLSSCQPPRITDPPFKIGDHLPAFTASGVLNHQTGSFSLSDYKDKLLILDFMATSCIGCIRSLPKLDSLQQQYKNKLQFVLVTEEKIERVAIFLKNNKSGGSIHFPVIAADTVLKSWFPHEFISHMVWIYKGTVLAITRSDYVTSPHIETALSGKQPMLPVKNDYFEFDFTKPLLSFEALGDNKKPAVQFFSGMRSAIPAVPRSSRRFVDTVAGTQRWLFVNYSIAEFYLHAYGLPLTGSSGRVETNIADRNKLIFDPAVAFREDWNKNNTYCYEAIFPISYPFSRCMEYMRADLDRWFDLQSRIEKRGNSYLILTQNNFPNVPD